MAANVLVNQNASNLDVSVPYNGYSRVVVKTGQYDSDGNEIAYIAGTTSGRTLEVTNPWGNQAIANAILNKIRGWAYQPYDSENATVNPAFEVGDAVIVGDIFSGIYDSKIKFSNLFLADIRAPEDKEINHEYAYESPENRKYIRQFNELSTTLTINSAQIAANATAITNQGTQIGNLQVTANNISASVAAETTRATNAENTKLNSTNTNQSFGWSLNSTAFLLKNNNTEVFRFDANGLKFKSNGADVFTVSRTGGLYVKGNGEFSGKITASSGLIGGFTIGSSAIYKNISSFGANVSSGVYIGTNGIQCGSKFKVDASGNLTASTGTFTGSVYAKNIQYGGSYGTLNGAGITGSSVGTGALTSGINSSLGYANFSNDVFNSNTLTNYLKTKTLTATIGAELNGLQVNNNYLYVGGSATTNKATWKSLSVVTSVSVNANAEEVLEDVRVTNVQRNSDYAITYFSLDKDTTWIVGSVGFSQSKETIYYLGR